MAGVASTREASRCVGANGNGVTVNRADDALNDVRARHGLEVSHVHTLHDDTARLPVRSAQEQRIHRIGYRNRLLRLH